MDKAQFEGLIGQRSAAAPSQGPHGKLDPSQAPKAAAAQDTSAEQPVTLDGLAKNAALGAILLQDDRTPIYIEGLREWDASLLDQRVRARGVLQLRKLAPDPEVGPGGAVSHGMHGSSKVLTKASWGRSKKEQPRRGD